MCCGGVRKSAACSRQNNTSCGLSDLPLPLCVMYSSHCSTKRCNSGSIRVMHTLHQQLCLCFVAVVVVVVVLTWLLLVPHVQIVKKLEAGTLLLNEGAVIKTEVRVRHTGPGWRCGGVKTSVCHATSTTHLLQLSINLPLSSCPKKTSQPLPFAVPPDCHPPFPSLPCVITITTQRYNLNQVNDALVCIMTDVEVLQQGDGSSAADAAIAGSDANGSKADQQATPQGAPKQQPRTPASTPVVATAGAGSGAGGVGAAAAGRALQTPGPAPSPSEE